MCVYVCVYICVCVCVCVDMYNDIHLIHMSGSDSDEARFQRRKSRSMKRARMQCLPMNFVPEDATQVQVVVYMYMAVVAVTSQVLHVD